MELDQAVSSVRCRFITSTETIRVSSDPLSIPVKLGRKGLSDVINHLLGRSDNSAYDFLVYDESDPSGSKRMLLEYFLSLPRPSDGGKVDSDEWIGSVAGLKDTTGLGMFASGSYNGSLSLVYGNQTCVCSVSAHEGPIKAVAYGGGDIVVSGGQDKTLKTWRVTSSNELIPVGVGVSSNRSHESSIECCAVRDDITTGTSMVISGDWEGRLCLWSSGGGDVVPVKKQKKSSGGGDRLVSMEPVETWKAHAHCLSQVQWLENEPSRCVTASWDHSIKTWDVERQDCVNTINTSKVNTCIDTRDAMVVSGHTNGMLKLWDTRQESSSAVNLGDGGHSRGWISGVAWSPTLPNVIGASTHDGNLLLLDVRTTKPLYTLKAHGSKKSPEKGLCVAWSGNTVASGGTDKVLKMFSFSDIIQ